MSSKGLIYQFRRLHGFMFESKLKFARQFRQKKALKNCTPRTIFLVGTPIHPNIGDSAIVAAELLFLNKSLPHDVKLVEITEDIFRKYRKLAIRSIKRTVMPVLWHGGGNMGDVWLEEELTRRDLIQRLEGKRIISFPQTIFYSNTTWGSEQANASIPCYDGRSGLTLLARERRSYEIMKSLYPNTDIRLMPDIVLSSDPGEFGVPAGERKGVLLCIRNDKEKKIDNDLWKALESQILSLGETVQVTDMESNKVIFPEYRTEVVRQKLQEFRKSKLVVTDRLHGMVFAALTGTPCIALGNNNHKVKSTYEWIDYLPYVKFVETIDEAVKILPELLRMEECIFDNSPLQHYYDELREIILESVAQANIGT